MKSAHIFDEWQRVMQRKGISEKEATRRTKAPSHAFPDALVMNYEGLISTFTFLGYTFNCRFPFVK